nr:hypothetical protein [Tanacetum cinerariifolium]
MRVENSRNSYLIYDICGGAHKANEYDSNKSRKQVCLSGKTSMTTPLFCGFIKMMISHHEEMYDEEKKENKGLGEMLDQQRNEMHNEFSQILATFEHCQTQAPKHDAPTFAVTTRLGITTHDPPYPTPSNSTNFNDTEREIRNEGPKIEEATTMKSKKTPHSPILYHPSKSSSVPFLSRLKKQKKDDDDE